MYFETIIQILINTAQVEDSKLNNLMYRIDIRFQIFNDLQVTFIIQTVFLMW